MSYQESILLSEYFVPSFYLIEYSLAPSNNRKDHEGNGVLSLVEVHAFEAVCKTEMTYIQSVQQLNLQVPSALQ